MHLYYSTPKGDDALRVKNSVQWKDVVIEDVGVVEGMQRGRHAIGFDGGHFSPVMDSPTHVFHDWCAGKIEAHRAAKQVAE